MRRIPLISAIPIALAVGILGEWMSWRSGREVLTDIGIRSDLFFDVLFSPHISDISDGGRISDEVIEAIRMAVDQSSPSLDVVATKIWSPDGRILYASDASLSGRSFPIDEGLAGAFGGSVVVETGSLDHREAYYDDVDLIESYVPIRETPDGPVVFVAELYQNASALDAAIARTRLRIWLVGGLGAVGIIAGLGRAEASSAPTGIKEGPKLAEGDAGSIGPSTPAPVVRPLGPPPPDTVAEGVERHLRRIGADLHDGAGQLIAVALLKLEVLFPRGDRDEGYRLIRGMLNEAAAEIRDMAAGLMLPHVREQSLAEAVGTVVAAHRGRTRTEVALAIEEGLNEPDVALKIAACRFVQEGLTNAFRHAGGMGQSVSLRRNDGGFTVIVQDRGPGFMPHSSSRSRQSLGLLGLRDRVEGLGGKFEITSLPGEGTTICAHFH